MALVLADRVQETTTTTGTGTVTLAGAVNGYQSFATIGNSNTTYYTIVSGSAWEVGIGTYSTTGPTLARTTILSSSAAGAAITLAGTSYVFATYPAEKSVNQDASGNVGIGTTSPSTFGLLAAVKNATGVTTVAVSNSNASTNDGAKFSSFYSTTEVASIGHYWNGSAFIGRLYSYGDLTFLGTSTPTELMRLTATGNLLVGTTSSTWSAANRTNIGIGGGSSGSILSFKVNNVDSGYLFHDGTNLQLLNNTASGALIFDTNATEQFRILATGGITSAALPDAVGYKGLPQNSQTASYTLALTDMGKHISITTGGVVIPANASVAFPIGSAVTIFNNSGSNQTISITTDTLRQAGTANTGSRTLAQYGIATVLKVTSTVWVISGAGVS